MPGMSYPIERRRFVADAGKVALGVFAGPALLAGDVLRAVPRPGPDEPLPAGLFTLGVASGDPAPDGVVLWTRLAPEGRMPSRPVDVRWEVAHDERFTRLAARGTATAEPRLGHSVHVEVAGLDAHRWYFYRFLANGEASPTGRTWTAPAVGVQKIRFAFASCQNYQAGYYTAYPHLVAEEVDFVAFLGDYIYEDRADPKALRRHDGTDEPATIAGYRARYAHYKADPELQRAHAAAPWIVTLDDHEVDNNWQGEYPQDPDQQTPEGFKARRTAALQAYWEHMPLRASARPRGSSARIFRRLALGDLATLHVLDTRQYRSRHAGSIGVAEEPGRTMTGDEQERWLLDGLHSSSRWNLIANQTQLASVDHQAGPEEWWEWDNWDGYRAQRRRLLERFPAVNNPVVITGDRHATWVSDLRPDFDRPDTPVVGAELVGSSVTSEGDPDRAAFARHWTPIMAESPHWRYIDNRRGYFVCDLTPDGLDAALRVVDTVRAPTSPIRTAGRFHVTAGVRGIEPV
ncbi:alkaline phosphatase D family protein [Virgisporangium aurantiacum]|uniref:Alkaline phosphatase n=1 Tax=Virgisporangium aurantiacum TaxID=175570 RepID=A0A8J3ZDT3_9ACTN|nr:alkaline phosphatase D family protein [Virgisporangium aurantiacum]GIJ60963.1 alkaline phosphatase [Virgisporangium aurantiacum]